MLGEMLFLASLVILEVGALYGAYKLISSFGGVLGKVLTKGINSGFSMLGHIPILGNAVSMATGAAEAATQGRDMKKGAQSRLKEQRRRTIRYQNSGFGKAISKVQDQTISKAKYVGAEVFDYAGAAATAGARAIAHTETGKAISETIGKGAKVFERAAEIEKAVTSLAEESRKAYQAHKDRLRNGERPKEPETKKD